MTVGVRTILHGVSLFCNRWPSNAPTRESANNLDRVHARRAVVLMMNSSNEIPAQHVRVRNAIPQRACRGTSLAASRARGAGTGRRAQGTLSGAKNAFDIQGVVPEHVRSLLCEGEPSRRALRAPVIPKTSRWRTCLRSMCSAMCCSCPADHRGRVEPVAATLETHDAAQALAMRRQLTI